MSEIEIVALDPDCHVNADAARVMDLFQRASDYVHLEKGTPPDLSYLRETFDGPPKLAREDRFVLALERDRTLLGTAAYIRNFYDTGEWYMGLLLLDPTVRGQGYGSALAARVIDQARQDGGTCIRIAVLEANPNARRFWEKHGYVLERSVPGDPEGDGHIRHVLKQELGGCHAA